jgi:hypothetical protein
MLLRITLASVLVLALGAHGVAADVLEPPADEGGHASFARQIVPKLLGRKPRGVLEIQLLADIAALRGREAVVRMLMEQDEFRAHWRAVLIDQMKTQRETAWGQKAECYAGPLASPPPAGKLSEAAPAPNLAVFVRDAAITESYPGSFNMFELIGAALELDDLFPVYRAYLYTLGNTVQDSAMMSAAEDRAIVGAHFDEVFLGRNLECMTCHNSERAVTQAKGRHHPLHAGLDPAVFDHPGGEPPPIDPDTFPAYEKCVGCHGSTGEGMAPYPSILGSDADDISDALEMVPVMKPIAVDAAELAQLVAALSDPGPFAEQNLPETAAKHFAFWRRDFFSADDPLQGFGPWNISPACAVVRYGAPTEGPIPAFFGGFESSYGTVHDLDDALVAGRALLTGASQIDGATAFAYMVAAKITENVWTELMGSPLTVVNYYARNPEQKGLHRYLTEQVFIQRGWSLKELISEILALRYFNRRAPAGSLQDHFDELAPIFDAFVPESRTCSSDPSRATIDDYAFAGTSDDSRALASDSSQSDAQCAYNGQGELVHRYSPRTLLGAAGKTLGWPAPESFAGDDYPSVDFQKALGQYLSNFDPGRTSVDFQALLSWDDAYSRCDKTGTGVAQDWIDALVAGLDPFNAAHPDEPLTLRDVVLTLKDWFIQEPALHGYAAGAGGTGLAASTTLAAEVPQAELAASEPQLVETLFGVALDTPITSASIDESKLRELCGVYLKSPQSMLAGVVRNDALAPPRLRVCNGAACSYAQMCQTFSPSLADLGYNVQCQSGSVRVPLDLGVKTLGQSLPSSGAGSTSLATGTGR